MVGFAQPNLLAFLLHLYFMKFWPDIQWCGYSKISAFFPLAKKNDPRHFCGGGIRIKFQKKICFCPRDRCISLQDVLQGSIFSTQKSGKQTNKQTNKHGVPMCACAFVLMIGSRSRLQTWHLNWAAFKTLMTFHYTDWFIGILIMTSYDPHFIGWYTPQFAVNTQGSCSNCPHHFHGFVDASTF